MTAALLDGTARIADLPDAAAMLGLPVQGRYAVLAVAGARRAPHGAGRPPLTLAEGTQALWHSAGEVELAILPLGAEPAADTEPPGEAGTRPPAPAPSPVPAPERTANSPRWPPG